MKGISKKQLQIIRALCEDWNSGNISVQKLGGQTNQNFVVTQGAESYFVRIPWESDVINRKVEGKNILALSRNKKSKSIIPHHWTYILKKRNILDPSDTERYDVPDGTLITDFIEGREFTMSDFQKAELQKRFVQLLHTFHASGVRFANSYDPFKDEIKVYRRRALRGSVRRFFNRKTREELIEIEKDAEQNLADSSPVSTHNDTIFQNILVGNNGRLYLLDFEYAGFNKKGGIFYDIAYPFRDSFFRSTSLSKKTFERFLSVADKVYRRKLDRKQIYWSVIAALLVGVWWGIVRHTDVISPQEKRYFKAYVLKGIQGIQQIKKELGFA